MLKLRGLISTKHQNQQPATPHSDDTNLNGDQAGDIPEGSATNKADFHEQKNELAAADSPNKATPRQLINAGFATLKNAGNPMLTQ